MKRTVLYTMCVRNLVYSFTYNFPKILAHLSRLQSGTFRSVYIIFSKYYIDLYQPAFIRSLVLFIFYLHIA